MGAAGAIILAIMKGRLTFDLTRQAAEVNRQALRLRRLHPDRRARILADVLRRRTGTLGRGTAGIAARRPDRLPDLRQRRSCSCWRSSWTSSSSPSSSSRCSARSGREARHRPDLVRRDPRRQHADELHASAVRLRAVLSAIRGAARILHRPRHRQAHGAGDHRTNLLGRGAIRDHPVHHGRTRDRRSRRWSCTTRAPAPTVDPATIKTSSCHSSTCRHWTLARQKSR